MSSSTLSLLFVGSSSAANIVPPLSSKTTKTAQRPFSSKLMALRSNNDHKLRSSLVSQPQREQPYLNRRRLMSTTSSITSLL